MMPSNYISLRSEVRAFDLDAVYEVVRGFSSQRVGWTSIVVFDPSDGCFIEVRTSPEDVRGNAQDEAQEVDGEYLLRAYGIGADDLAQVVHAPSRWKLIDQR
jgi:hypothetical protein